MRRENGYKTYEASSEARFELYWGVVQGVPTSFRWTCATMYVLRYARCKLKFQAGWGYDFRRDMDVSWEDYGSYATDIFTNEATKAINGHNQSQPLFLYLAHLAVHSANTYMPLQAPAEIVDLFDNIQDENRRCV